MGKLNWWVVGVVGLMLGLVFADIDGSLSRTPFGGWIQHRSLLTHSFLVPWVLWGLARRNRDTQVRWFSLGFSAAMATHLCFDLFPWTWQGFARIHAPLVGRLDPTLSALWIVGSLLVCLLLAFSLVRRRDELAFLLFALALSFAALLTNERRFWLPLLTLGACSAVAWRAALPRALQRRVGRW